MLQRAQYLHVLADLLAAETVDNRVPRGPAVRGLDVGVGASCVYPLVGHAEYGWAFVGTEVDEAVRPPSIKRRCSSDMPLPFIMRYGSATHLQQVEGISHKSASTRCS